MLISLGLLTSCVNPVVPPSLTTQEWEAIAQQNSILSGEEIRATAKLTPLDTGQIWINFNNEKLCGHYHCLFAIYELTDYSLPKLKWRAYLDPYLPPPTSLMSPTDNNCLQINQVESKQVQGYELCLVQNQYQLRKIPSIQLSGD